MSLRLQLAEAYLRDPGGWSGKLGSRLDRLVERYDIATTAQSPSWDLPSVAAATAAPTRAPLNVLVVFVDTLRADTAHSTSVMPRLNALRGESLSFERAYAAASDTVSVLPVLTGGCYGQVPCPGDVLAVARQLDIRTGLVIARSAQRFLGKLSPHFAFDDVVAIPDYEEGQKVWGYGATGTTARGVTREALAWMAQHRGERFLLWAFHFDVHNWMHLEDAHLTAVAARHDIEKSTEDRHWRYAAAVAGVDEAIGELVDGMQTQGLFDDTALLIVSDHGEALGQHGHAYHAVYLWQSLVHVPMLLHVKGVAARDVQTPAGHVDVAPTVLSLLAPDAPRLNYHGASLIDGDAELSANPLLMLSMRKDDLLRIGIVDRHPPFMKLELPLDSVEPELYDLDASDPDATDVRADNRVRALELLSGLVTSPVFPRPEGEEDAKSPGARE